VVEVVGGMDIAVPAPPPPVPPRQPLRVTSFAKGVVPMAPTGPAAIRVPEPVRAEAPRLEPRRVDLQAPVPAPVPAPASWRALVVLSDPTADSREEAVGALRLCWDSAGSPGPEWLPCDGRRIDPAQHDALTALLRTQGDGDLDEVRLPDFRGLRIGPGQLAGSTSSAMWVSSSTSLRPSSKIWEA
jgi:hypothetical protein